MTATGSSHWTLVDGLRMHALRWASAAAAPRPPIVLVHGLGVSSRYMIPTAERLAGRFAVWAPDLPGFGRSEAPKHMNSLMASADALDGWLVASGITQPLLVGNSYGCQVIADLIARKPGRACGIVLSAPTVQASRRSIVGEMFRLMRDIPRERLALVPVVASDYLHAGVVRMMRTLRGAIVDRIEDKLVGLETPALLVRGSRDPIVSGEWLEYLAGRMVRARVVTIEGAGHAVNFSAARRFSELITEFCLELGF